MSTQSSNTNKRIAKNYATTRYILMYQISGICAVFVHSPIYAHGLYLRQELSGKDEEICRYLMKKSASRPMINIMSV